MVRINPGRWMRLGLLAALGALAAFGQESTGSILGTVTDTTGAGVPEAKVVATSPRTPRGVEATTDANGNFNLLNIPVGLYSVTVTKAGFTTFKSQNIEVRIGSQVSLSPKLSVGQISEVVEVSADAVAIDTTSSRTQTTITQSTFENIQKGRTFNSILALAPGVRTEVKGGNAGVGGISVDGASGSENAYFIDGVEVSDVRRGSLRQQNALPLEFVQELSVRSGGFEAEYGGATGGVINVVTKGGQNDFHGQFWFQGTGDSLNARDRGYWQRSPANADVADFFRPKEDSYKILYPGGIVSGRIIRDRMFFTSGYAPEIEHTDRVINYTAGAQTFKQDLFRHYMTNRLDLAATQKLQVYGTWTWSPFRRSGYLPNRDTRVPVPAGDLSKLGGFVPAQTASAGVTYALTSRLVLSGRYGYRYLNDKDNNYGLSGAPYIQYNQSSIGLAGVPADAQQSSGFLNVPSTFQTIKDITTRHNVYLDASYIATLFGQQHTFKGGYAYTRLGNEVQDDYTNGYFTINWNDSFSRGSVQNVRGAYGYYTWEDGVRHNSGVSSRNQGMYIQDTWRVNRRLTLNLGVRFENEFLPPYVKEVNNVKVANPISFDWGSKIAPRLGAAWDVMGDGKWKLAGSFGLFYDVMKYELARGSFGGDIWFSNVYRLDNPNVFQLSKTNPAALGTLISRYNNRTIPINAQGVLDGIDPNIKPYTSREFSVSLERQLTSRMIAAMRYTHKDLLRAIEDIGVLDPEDNEVYLIGNPGEGETRNTASVYGQKTPNGNFLVPKPVRKYDAVEFRIQGQIGHLSLIPSYTWSRLYGNYSGLANSDESGRSDPGVSRAYDLPYYYFDASGSQKTVLGRLGTDRPHTFKFFGSYDLRSKLGSTVIGVNQIAYSGTPDTTTVIYLSAPTSPFGRGDLGRTPVLTQTDLYLAHSFKPTERTTVKFELEARNLFNQAAAIARVSQINRNGAITIDPTQFFKGYNVFDYVKVGTGSIRYNPIYGLPGASYRAGGGPGTTLSSAFSATNPNFGAYQDFRVLRLGVRFLF